MAWWDISQVSSKPFNVYILCSGVMLTLISQLVSIPPIFSQILITRLHD